MERSDFFITKSFFPSSNDNIISEENKSTENKSAYIQTAEVADSKILSLSQMGLPMLPSFVIGTSVYDEYLNNQFTIPSETIKYIEQALREISFDGLFYDKIENPLYLTIKSSFNSNSPNFFYKLNHVGITAHNLDGFSNYCGQRLYVWKTYVSFLLNYAKFLLKLDPKMFMDAASGLFLTDEGKRVVALTESHYKKLVLIYKELIIKNVTSNFKNNLDKVYDNILLLDDPMQQFWNVIEGMYCDFFQYMQTQNNLQDDNFNSKRSPKALGPQIHVGVMLYQKASHKMIKGKIYSRNKVNGANFLSGYFETDKYENDIFISEKLELKELASHSPEDLNKLVSIIRVLEYRFRWPQVIHFCIQGDDFWIFDVKKMNFDSKIKFRVICDMLDQSIVSVRDALNLFDVQDFINLQESDFKTQITSSLLASNFLVVNKGLAGGSLVFNKAEVDENSDLNKLSILVCSDLNQLDDYLYNKLNGLILINPSSISDKYIESFKNNQLVVIKINQSTVKLDIAKEYVDFNGTLIYKDAYINIDGLNGHLYNKGYNLTPHSLAYCYSRIHYLSKQNQSLTLVSRATSYQKVIESAVFSSSEVGILDLDNVFLKNESYIATARSIFSGDQNKTTLNNVTEKLFNIQLEEYKKIFGVVCSQNVDVKFLGLDLTSFFSSKDLQNEELSKKLKSNIKARYADFSNILDNLSISHINGVRLSLFFPEIYQSQLRAIVTAIYKNSCCSQEGIEISIILPSVINQKEVILIKKIIKEELDLLQKQLNIKIYLSYGALINIPAALINSISEISEELNFICYDIYSLAKNMMGVAIENKASNQVIFDDQINLGQPDLNLDKRGLGRLLRRGIILAKGLNPHIYTGVYSEKYTVEDLDFYGKLGVDYFVCGLKDIFNAQFANTRICPKKPNSTTDI